jgi:hypothetical protein
MKAEEIRRIAGRLDEAKTSWEVQIEVDRETVESQSEALLTAVRMQNDELRGICSEVNESASGTERYNRDLIR